MLKSTDYWVKDINLALNGKKAIEQSLIDMPGLVFLEASYKDKEPLKGTRITGCVLVTYETAAFVLLLKKLGADVRWCSDNRFASLDDACAYLASEGIPVFATGNMSEKEYFRSFEQAIQFKDNKGNFIGPNLMVDDGCDITRFLHKKHPEIYKNVLGTCEQTTCGVTEHYKLQKKGKLKTSVININESVTKAKFDNIYGSRESLIEGIQNAINMQIGGKHAVVFGYGEVGKGCTKVLRGLGAIVYVVEIDPIMAMQAHMEGFEVLSKKRAMKTGDIFVTATGCNKTIDSNDLLNTNNNSVFMNMGHGNMEINTEYLNNTKSIVKEKVNKNVDKYTLENSKDIYLLAQGYLINLLSGNGHPPRVMSITFTNHVLALIDLLNNSVKYKKGEIYKLSRKLDEQAAKLNFPELKEKITKLTSEQAEYLGFDINGPFKRDDYRY